MLSLLSKQKINTKSLTEAELVGVDDAIIFGMQTKHFFESQVRSINLISTLKPLGSDVTMKQNNTSVIQLERNKWKSRSKRAKHITVRYLYITDHLKVGDINRLIYKLSEEMESNYFIKALQRKLFHIYCKTLMELDGIDEFMFYK